MENGGAVNANFTWQVVIFVVQSRFRYERALEMPTAQTYSDINFEMACVMYQIGAVHAAIAGVEDRQSDDVRLNYWKFQQMFRV